MAVDIGSSSTRSALFDDRATPFAKTAASTKYKINYTSEGGAELDPRIVLAATSSCVDRSLRDRGKRPIAGVSGSAFWHGLLGLDRRARLITPIWTWADSRSIPDAAELRQQLDERRIHARTGCMLRSPFWPAKLRWLRRTDPRLFRRVHRWISPSDWIFQELFGTRGCSHSMASATGLYDLGKRSWDHELCRVCGVTAEQLGSIGDGAAPATSGPRALRDALIFPAIGDGAAGNLGSGAARSRVIAINIGTSAAVRMIETNRSGQKTRLPLGLFRYVVDEKRSVIGGAISNAGNLHQWCGRELRVKKAEPISRATAATDPLTVLPFWVHERAPSWPEHLHGVLLGLTQSTTAAEILRATTCSVFYRLAQIVELLESATGRATSIIVGGGILHAPDAVRLLADALGRDICLSTEPEASLRGAALHALVSLGGKDPKPKPGTSVSHDRRLAQKHRARRQRQIALEHLLGGEK